MHWLNKLGLGLVLLGIYAELLVGKSVGFPERIVFTLAVLFGLFLFLFKFEEGGDDGF